MLNKIVEFSLKNRLLVIILNLLFLIIGVIYLFKTPIDAFPDTTPIQVQINTVAPSLSPEEIEQQITLPVELSIAGIPGLINVRSISKFGFCQVVANFDDSIHIYDARQLILERLGEVELPDGIEKPKLGPISTGLGEIFHYMLTSNDKSKSLEELRTIHDWIIKPELRKVPGVAEINSWGGFEKQYQVSVSPDILVKYNLTLEDVFSALENNNSNAGGGLLNFSGQSYLVHGIGRVNNISQIENIVVKAFDGGPVLIKDIATVQIGSEIRRGAITYNGKGEAVMGLGFMLMGENSKTVSESLLNKLENIRPFLPEGVELEVVYDRTDLVKKVITTVKENLIAGAFLVIAVLFLILGNIRSGLLVAITIPMAMIFAVIGMNEFSIVASLLSLGAIDFGIIVDGSVVMTENNMRKLSEKQQKTGKALSQSERLEIVLSSSKEVLRPMVFGMLIILVVFIPILTLQGVEGKMFKPMALTFMFALIGALIIATTLSPILSYYFLPKSFSEKKGLIDKRIIPLFEKYLRFCLEKKIILLSGVVGLLILSGLLVPKLGGEFVPKLSEGSIVVNLIRLAGVSVEESVKSNIKIEKLLKREFDNEIYKVWSRIGSAELATDPMGIELTDIFMTLKPRKQWTRAKTQSELAEKIKEILAQLPGVNMALSQPIELRVNEMASGIRSDIGIKIIGDDFDKLVEVSDKVQNVLSSINGASDIAGEQITGQPTVQIVIKQSKIARYGLQEKQILNFIEILGNKKVGKIYEGQKMFPLVVKAPESFQKSINNFSGALVSTSKGITLPLSEFASINIVEGPSTINREWGRRLIKVQCNVRNRDVISFVNEAKNKIKQDIDLPEGYLIEWGGQYENLERSKKRFAIVVPLTLALVFILLFFSLKKLKDVLIIYTGIPFAVIGGIFALWIRNIPFSVSAAVGFIALCGIAVLNGQVLISAISNFLDNGISVSESVVQAAKQRLRPVLATAITDAAGFIPMAISTGVGSEVQRPLATVVIGGVITSTLLTLFVLPILYKLLTKKPQE